MLVKSKKNHQKYIVTFKVQLNWHTTLYHAKSKHIELQCHFVREKIESKEIEFIYCNTSDNVAHIFTKLVGKIHFEVLRKKLGVEENSFLH